MRQNATRMTVQRQIILEELRKVDTHPTADEVYDMVRSRLPQISLGTVYRNLDFLSARGVISRLDLGTGKRHYDGNPEPHGHIRCVECDRVFDLPEEADAQLNSLLGTMITVPGFKMLGCSVEFTGLCPVCMAQDGSAGDTLSRKEDSDGKLEGNRD